MSHFISIRTRIHEREALLEALEDLGHRVVPGVETVTGDRGEEPVEFAIATGCDSRIGFRRIESGEIGAHREAYEIVADWYSVELGSPLRRAEFVPAVEQRYAYRIIRDQAETQDLIIEEETDVNGEIVLVLSERG